MAWSPQQEEALKAVSRWLQDRRAPQVFRLFGYAGTGKTTLAKEIAANVNGMTAFACFTGKAALVLKNKGCEGASTIHSMIYAPAGEDEDSGELTWEVNPGSRAALAKLIIIDECSMVNDELGKDLLSFGTKVLVLGDPAQLPPVKGAGFFTDHEPDIMLTEIHRQAAGNPIIALAKTVREGGRLSCGQYGTTQVVIRSQIKACDVLAADQVLVGLNRTRRLFNGRIRTLLERAHPIIPEKGDRLVCLKNNRRKKLLNGGLWDVCAVANGSAVRRDEPLDRANTFAIKAVPDTDPKARPTAVKVPREFFEGNEERIDKNLRRSVDEFDFGYALTVHKSQGSQWRNVMVFDESAAFREDRARHLYTAITRAADRLTVVQAD